MDLGDGKNAFISNPAVQKMIEYKPVDLSELFIEDQSGNYVIDRKRLSDQNNYEIDEKNKIGYIKLGNGNKIDFKSFQSAMKEEEERIQYQKYQERLIDESKQRDKRKDPLGQKEDSNPLIRHAA